MASLQADFNRYYAEQLRPCGFQKLKGQPCFGRIVNGEVLHTLKLKIQYPMIRGQQCFNVLAGAWSVFSFPYACGIDRYTFDNDSRILACFVPDEKRDVSAEDSLHWGLHCDESSRQEQLARSFAIVRDYVLPYLDSIQTIRDYIRHCKRWNPNTLRCADQFYGDAPLLILTDNHEDFMDSYQQYCDTILHQCYDGDENHPEYIENKERMYQYYIIDTAGARDKVYADPVLYARCREELERRRTLSAANLRAVGLQW